MIKKITAEDKIAYIEMAKDFYSSEAVQHNVPDKHFIDTFDELMKSDNYVIGYIFEHKNNTAGYTLLVKTFSQEAGGKIIWVDELYVKPEYRGCGIGHEFFAFLKTNIEPDEKCIRLEVEASNKKAISLYMQMGFENLPYAQMIKSL